MIIIIITVATSKPKYKRFLRCHFIYSVHVCVCNVHFPIILQYKHKNVLNTYSFCVILTQYVIHVVFASFSSSFLHEFQLFLFFFYSALCCIIQYIFFRVSFFFLLLYFASFMKRMHYKSIRINRKHHK